jgi:hypothetical protein
MVLVPSLALAPAPSALCTAKYCAQGSKHSSFATPRLGGPPDPDCLPCNRCQLPLVPRGSGFQRTHLKGGEPLQCTGDDCTVQCPPYKDLRYRMIARIEPFGEDLFWLSEVQLKRLSP